MVPVQYGGGGGGGGGVPAYGVGNNSSYGNSNVPQNNIPTYGNVQPRAGVGSGVGVGVGGMNQSNMGSSYGAPVKNEAYGGVQNNAYGNNAPQSNGGGAYGVPPQQSTPYGVPQNGPQYGGPPQSAGPYNGGGGLQTNTYGGPPSTGPYGAQQSNNNRPVANIGSPNAAVMPIAALNPYSNRYDKFSC